MDPLIIANVGLVIVGLPCVLLVVGGLPGAWMLLGLAAAIELADPLWLGPGVTSIGWGVIAAGTAAAVLGELIEFISGSIGAKTGGGTRKGMIGAFIGGMAGAIVATFLIPVPVLGTLIGALLGTFGGAWVGEMSGMEGASPEAALRPALAATIGRVVGTVAKVGVALVVWIAVSAGAIHTLLT